MSTGADAAGAGGTHLAGSRIAGYAAGTLRADQLGGAEAHLERCADCRAALAALVPRSRADAGWRQLSERLDEPSRSRPERLFVAAGVPEHLVRLAMATPALRRSWLVAAVLALLFALAAARLAPTASATLLLLVAPLVPVAGVALSYGPAADPMYEWGLVAPVSGLRLVLLRSATVLLASALLGAGAALAMPVRGPALFGWLAPSLAVVALVLALSAYLDPGVAAGAAGAAWAAAVLGAGRGGAGRSALLTGPAQASCVLVALLAAGFVAARRHRFEQAPWRPGRRPAT
ncbi:zf-HC2 domain-containing protein [Kitasatospora phosalacinea]|uniref:zf-HC2 domain-containing protein n=1 Tax=Kitasatospora phosalacinea TaxID=2065 RepID=UPI00364B286F